MYFDELKNAVRDSAVFVAIFPSGETDEKFSIEIGLAVMLDKPLILIVKPGTHFPEKLARVCDRIVEGSDDSEEMANRLAGVMREMGVLS